MADRPPLVLHIGMPKAGSSSIQASLAKSRKELKRQGIVWPDEAQARGGNYDMLAKAVLGVASPRNLKQFGRFLDRHQDKLVAVSSEFFWRLDADAVRALRQRVAPRTVRLAIYIRPYRSWVRAVYLQHARTRRPTPDFDTRFADLIKSASLRRQVSAWAEGFGRDALHIRHVSAIEEGDVVGDYMALAGAEDWRAAATNATPHWFVCELARAMFRHEPDRGELYRQKTAFRAWLSELDRAIGRRSFADARYLTTSQWREADARFREDAEWLHETFGVPPPDVGAPPAEERPFLPTLAAAPDEVFDFLERQIGKSAIVAETPYLATAARSAVAASR